MTSTSVCTVSKSAGRFDSTEVDSATRLTRGSIRIIAVAWNLGVVIHSPMTVPAQITNMVATTIQRRRQSRLNRSRKDPSSWFCPPHMPYRDSRLRLLVSDCSFISSTMP